MSRLVSNIVRGMSGGVEGYMGARQALGNRAAQQKQDKLNEIKIQNATLDQQEKARLRKQQEGLRTGLGQLDLTGLTPQQAYAKKQEVFRQQAPTQAFKEERVAQAKLAGKTSAKADSWQYVPQSGEQGEALFRKTDEYGNLQIKGVTEVKKDVQAQNMLRIANQTDSPQQYAQAMQLMKATGNSFALSVLPQEYDKKIVTAYLERGISPEKKAKLQIEVGKLKLNKQQRTDARERFKKSHALQVKEMELELSKPLREQLFAQQEYKKEIPKYLSEKLDKDRLLTVTKVKEINTTNNKVSDIYKKLTDLEGMVKNTLDWVTAKGTGEKARKISSQVAQIITDYNVNIAKLGALAGEDLTILRDVLPNPTDLKAMTYNAWKKTVANLKKNIQENYQSEMKNAGINISGNMLDEVVKRSRVEGATVETKSAIQRMRERRGSK